ncbi:MAG: recombinase family protein, partial [Candidatus Cloacimonetes bacterium]|nr:recombinase family protein [Candidatus Cloacimonadota bacterium]
MSKTNKDGVKFILYARKSSETEDRQAASIEDQINELTRLAKKNNWEIIDILQEAQSAKKPGRPIFNKMLDRIHRGDVDGIICWKLDRLARNPIDGGSISWILQQGVIKEIQTFDRTYLPGDNVLMMQVEFGMANQYVRDLSVTTKRGLRGKAEKGWLPSLAPIGYLNNKYQDKKYKGVVEDPQRFQQIRHLFDLMLTGQYSVAKIWEIAKDEMNLRTRKHSILGDKPLSRSSIYTMLTNSYYYGWFEYPSGSGNWYKGAHKPMITQLEYDRIQILLGRKDLPRPKEHNFAFTGLMKCGHCGCSITAESKSKHCKNGKTHDYIYYHCTKKRIEAKCQEASVELKDLELQIKEKLSEIKISNRFKDWAIKHLNELRKDEVNVMQTASKSKSKEREECREQLQALTINYTSKANLGRELISDETFKEMKANLEKKIDSLTDAAQQEDEDLKEWVDLSIKTFNFACHASIWFEKGNNEDRKAILSCLG